MASHRYPPLNEFRKDFKRTRGVKSLKEEQDEDEFLFLTRFFAGGSSNKNAKR
jgi:hypothetical protein